MKHPISKRYYEVQGVVVDRPMQSAYSWISGLELLEMTRSSFSCQACFHKVLPLEEWMVSECYGARWRLLLA